MRNLELFFDLVFVFAFTQVTQLMADAPTVRGPLRGMVLLAPLWFLDLDGHLCEFVWMDPGAVEG